LDVPSPQAEPLLYVEGRYRGLGDAPHGIESTSRPSG
jgi:hypothetical protein